MDTFPYTNDEVSQMLKQHSSLSIKLDEARILFRTYALFHEVYFIEEALLISLENSLEDAGICI